MRLINEFTIATSPDEAYELLLDLGRVAPCVPGGEIGEPDAEGAYPGRVSVKVGPMKFVYEGRVRIAQRDPAARTAVISGEGRASGGADIARIATTMEVLPDGTGSLVRMSTELDLKGRAAQMGQGIIADVARRLVREAATCIEARLTAPDGTDPTRMPVAQPVAGLSLMASVVGSKVGGSVRRLGERVRGDDPAAKGESDATR